MAAPAHPAPAALAPPCAADEALETRLAYQEAALRDLSDVIARQQQQIERLEQTCRQLVDRIGRMSQPVEKLDPEDDVPPHY